MDVDSGTVLHGRYRLDRRISSGGMGEVWAAHDTLLDRPVAVKLLRDELASHPGFRERFRSEARAAAALAHPGVVAVYDYGEQDGTAFLAMELVDGEPLSARLRRGPLSTAETLQVVAQSAAALAAAHAAGLVHRDVKPANLLLRDDGRVVVTDFGIARSLADPSRTEVGTVVGTVNYMSPEQLRGEPVTPATDLYSLGAVAFECLTGRRPYPREDSIAVAMAHLHEPVPPLPPDVPAAVQRLVNALLEKDPARRPASAAQVAATAAALGGAQAARRAPAAAAVPPMPTAPLSRLAASAAPAGAAAAHVAGSASADVTSWQGAPGAAPPSGRGPVAGEGPAAGTGVTLRAPAPGSSDATTAVHEPTAVAPVPAAQRGLGRGGGRRPRPARAPTDALRALRWPAWWPVPARRGAVAVAVLATVVAVLLIGLVAAGALGGGRPGVAVVTVPRLTANPVATATSRLRSLGLRPAPTSADVPGRPANVVVGQRPAAGRRVRRGSRIVLTVASGYVTLPAGSLDGQPATAAAAAIERLGLQVATQTTPSAAPIGDVVSFTPFGRLAEGTTVTVAVATTPTTTTAPPPPAGHGGPGGDQGQGPGHGGHGH